MKTRNTGKRPGSRWSLAMAFSALLASPVAAQEERPSLRPTDDYLELLVTQALAEDSVVESYEILVLADEGEVSLFGTVDSEEDRRRAEQVASGVEWVEEVRNEIEVVDPVYAVDKSDQAIEKDFWQSLQERMETVPSSFQIRVNHGEVVFSGRVDSRAQQEVLVKTAFDAGAVLVKKAELEIASHKENGANTR